jgi:pimeloyl-ACP methyl ester carboxylesterase
MRLMGRSGGGAAGEGPKATRDGLVRRLRRPDGSEIQVELYGPEDGPPVVLTHGWGADGTEWYYLKRQLADRFRLIVWDLPGLGLSRGPDNRDFSLEKYARDLEAVLGLAEGRPAVLLGHSIGGMITLTFCRLFPEALGTRVSGLALVHTTYTNPVRTTQHAGFYTAIEKPVIMPLLHLTIWLSPLVWIMNVLSYLNGSAHVSTIRSSYAGHQTWEQVDFMTRYQAKDSPAVLARGMFGMIHYDATATLGTLGLPTLVVPGDRDPVCQPEASLRIDREAPGARLAPLAPAKHLGLIEHHARFGELAAEFVAACSDSSAQPA